MDLQDAAQLQILHDERHVVETSLADLSATMENIRFELSIVLLGQALAE